MVRRGFKTELRWFVLFLATAFLIGYLSDAILLSLLVALSLYLIWVFRQLYVLENWVLQARRRSLQDNNLHGIWGDIADDIVLMSNRFDKEKLRLQAVVVRVQEMTAALSDCVILVDQQGHIEWWNNAAEQVLGFQAVDMGHNIANLIRHPRFVSYFEEGDYSEPLTLTDLNRENQHLEFQINTFGQGDRLIVVRDVTRLSKLEEMRKDFVANVSHELRTPLTVIRGYVEALADAQELPPLWAKALDQMQQQSQRMSGLINDLITLTKLETDSREIHSDEVRVEPMLRTIIDEAKAVSGDRQHQFNISGAEDIRLLGNERELRSAISNLVINGVNYSPPQTLIEINCQAGQQGAVIEVRDHGAGIDPKHIPRLTERFYRVDSSRSVASGGTGLGLAIVKHVLLRHDAELKIRSAPGKGSSFCCHFPTRRVITSPVTAKAEAR